MFCIHKVKGQLCCDPVTLCKTLCLISTSQNVLKILDYDKDMIFQADQMVWAGFISYVDDSLLSQEPQVFELRPVRHLLNCTFPSPPALTWWKFSCTVCSFLPGEPPWLPESRELAKRIRSRFNGKRRGNEQSWSNVDKDQGAYGRKISSEEQWQRLKHGVYGSHRGQNTPLSYIFDCNFTKSIPNHLTKTTLRDFCDCPQSKHSTAQNRVWCPRWV